MLLHVKDELVLLVSCQKLLIFVELFDSFADGWDFEPIFGIIEVNLSMLLAQAELLEDEGIVIVHLYVAAASGSLAGQRLLGLGRRQRPAVHSQIVIFELKCLVVHQDLVRRLLGVYRCEGLLLGLLAEALLDLYRGYVLAIQDVLVAAETGLHVFVL